MGVVSLITWADSIYLLRYNRQLHVVAILEPQGVSETENDFVHHCSLSIPVTSSNWSKLYFYHLEFKVY